jgi:DNA-binding transcriptional LysR family regulator
MRIIDNWNGAIGLVNNLAGASMINLRSVDLNLLVAFDALLAECHVTRAARRIGLSQPAMSNALARLRALFGDPLLVRGPGGMRPTLRAQELAEPLRGALAQLQHVFDAAAAFDPATARTVFRVRMGDMNAFIMLPPLLAALRRRAPGVSIETTHLPPQPTLDALEADSVQLALSMGLPRTGAVQSRALLADEVMLVLRPDHPYLGARNKGVAFQTLRHIRVSQSPNDTRFLDGYLARRNLPREVVLTLPHWLAGPAVVAQTDLVTIGSARMMRQLDTGLATLPLPFGPMRFNWAMYWHRRYDTQPAHRWLRALIAEVCAGLGPVPRPTGGPRNGTITSP